MNPLTPLSAIEQAWRMFVGVFNSQDILIFALLVVTGVILALGVALFAEFIGVDDDDAAT